MSSDASPIKKDNINQQKTLVTFVETISRIFKVGIYYPEGHAILDKAANASIYYLQQICPSLDHVQIEVAGNSLRIEETILPEASVAVKEFNLLFTKLGIRSVEFDKTISYRKLLFFVKTLMAWRMQLESAKSLITFNLTNLPVGIRVQQQEFLVDKDAILDKNAENAANNKLDDLCSALSQQGLDSAQVEQCRNLLEKIQTSSREVDEDIPGFPKATWDDVQNLLYKVITGSYSSDEQSFDASVAGDINVISSIFESLELSLTDKKYKETIRFLISHLSGRKIEEEATEEPKEVNKKKNLYQILDEDQKITVSDLKKYVYSNTIPLKILNKITIVDDSEKLSILLQLISADQNKEITAKLMGELKGSIVGKMTDREKGVLIDGIKHFADTKNYTVFRLLLTEVLSALRNFEENDSLDFVVDLWTKMPSSLHVLLWPFVVNELLVVGKTDKGKRFFEAVEIASYLHSEGMKRLCSQLEAMESFQKRSIAENIFDPSYIFSYKLFAFLFETSLGDQIGKQVLEELKKNPQDALLECVSPILDFVNPSHVSFLHAYLSQAHLKEPPLALKMEAGKIVAEYLSTISEEQKDEPWLSKTIIGAATLQVKGMEQLLLKITKDKKMGIIPSWPKSCRTAAESALKMMKRQSLNKLL